MRDSPVGARREPPAPRFLRLFLLLPLAALLALLPGCSSSIASPTKRYALVIGVQDYLTITPDLKYPDDDAVEMAALLESRGWIVADTLVNSEATYANIYADIAALSTDPDATILVYYSGHGYLDDGGIPYIIPYDASGIWSGSTYTLNKGITPAMMTNWLGSVPARHRILILDSCNSGGFSLGDNAVDTSPADYSAFSHRTSETSLLAAALSEFNALVANNLSTYGDDEILTLAAAGSEEFSHDDVYPDPDYYPGYILEQGAFTYYLLKAADFGDKDGDGFVTVDEAYIYAKTRIMAEWNLHYKSRDFLPHISGGTGDLVLYAK